jgi:hypothetical protein
MTGICAIAVAHGSNPKQSPTKRTIGVLTLDYFGEFAALSN